MSVLTVGSGQQYSTIASAIAASRSGDTIAVQAGTYYNDFASINKDITIVGVGGMANIVATKQPPNGKAIFTTDGNIRIENMSFSGVSVPDGNGAGIRYQSGNLTIVDSYFHDNEMNLLANTSPSGSITISGSEFANSNSTKLLGHSVYIGEIDTLTITDSYIHDASVGHEIKSRAHNTIITNNRIYDSATGNGSASYTIDIPDGGRAVITGNVIQQSAGSQNPGIVHFGGENGPYAGSSIQISGNTVINELGTSGARLLVNQTSATATVSNNQVYGLTPGQMASGSANVSGTTYLSAEPTLDVSHPWDSTTPTEPVPAFTVTLADTTPTQDQAIGASVVAAGTSLAALDFSYQWQSYEGGSWKNIAGATAAKYTPGAGEVGEALRLSVTASNGSAQSVVTSAATDVTGRHFVGTGSTADAPALTAGADLALGNGGNDLLMGLAGNDTLDGGAGADTLDGGTGSDRMVGGTGDDRYVVDAAGDVVVEAAGAGHDVVVTSLASYRIAVNVEDAVATNSAGASIIGNMLDNQIQGGSGADSLYGGEGADTLIGSAGADRLVGGPGDDLYIVDGTHNTVVEAAGNGTDTVWVTAGTRYALRANIETLVLQGAELTHGTGNASANTLIGNSGNNVLSGWDGADTIQGGGGNDILIGGAGRDVLTGGAGNDQFRFLSASESTVAAPDRITDFVAGQDRIDLRQIDANASQAGDQAFAYVANFGNHAGEVMVASAGGNLYQVRGDINGDGTADFAIDVTSASDPAANWFYL
jgi:Ca2+-binding RTX toxin-like protein